MIDANTETLLSFAEATKGLPRRRGGRKPHVSTLYRWADGGCKGIRLESLQVGGTRCTSAEALQRFFSALTAQTTHGTQPAGTRSTAARDRAYRLAVRELESEGA
jgi:hypothetical protein